MQIKTYSSFIFLSFLFNTLVAQVAFQEHLIVADEYERILAVADFNSDGYPDILTNVYSHLVFRKGLEDGSFDRIPIYATEDLGLLEVADFNDDEILDFAIVTNDFNDKKVEIWRSSTIDGFLPISSFEIVSKWTGLKLADIDEDGDIDIAGITDNKIFWWENDNLNFTERIVSEFVDKLNYLQLADIDDNGALDFIASSKQNDLLTCFLNDGQSNFIQKDIASGIIVDGIVAFEVREMDGDNLLEIICVNEIVATMVVHYQIDDFEFQSVIVEENVVEPRDIQAGDLDNDGDQDFIVAHGSAHGGYTWYEQFYIADIERMSIDNSVENATKFILADMDADLDLDFVGFYGDGYGNSDLTVSWWENNFCTSTLKAEAVGLCQGDTLNIEGQQYFTTGEYVVSAVDQFGCDSTVTVLIFPTEDPSPVQLNADEQTITVTNMEDLETAFWIDCVSGDTVIVTNEAVFAPTYSSSYQAILNSFGACQRSSECIMFDYISDVNILNSNPIQFFPNPTTGQINIEGHLDQIDELKLFNSVGIGLLQIRDIHSMIDISEFQSGIFWIEYQIDGKVYSERIVKLR